MKYSFVIPCYKAQAKIEMVVCEIEETMGSLKTDNYEIILVNDYPFDDTFLKITELCLKNTKIKGINLAKNFGQHAALMAGYSFATGDYIISLDDDGQTPANEVGKLIHKLEEGYDVVYARYNNKKHSLLRNWGSWLNDCMVQIMLGKSKDLYVSSYFICKKYVIDEILNYKNPYPYLIGLVLRVTRNIANVDVNHRQREVGSSGYTLKSLLKLWLNGFTAFSVIPLRMATVLGVLTSFLGFIFVIYVIIHKLLHPYVAMGWSSLISAVLIVGGMNMFVVGMIGEYIGRIYISINNSPQYVIRETINIDEKDTDDEL
jgi:Glycosyltransferases involved in cell wall biogenesis